MTQTQLDVLFAPCVSSSPICFRSVWKVVTSRPRTLSLLCEFLNRYSFIDPYIIIQRKRHQAAIFPLTFLLKLKCLSSVHCGASSRHPACKNVHLVHVCAQYVAFGAHWSGFVALSLSIDVPPSNERLIIASALGFFSQPLAGRCLHRTHVTLDFSVRQSLFTVALRSVMA